MILDVIVIAFWASPLVYLVMILLGKVFHRRRYRELLRKPRKRVDLVIFQIPTIGNVSTVNQIIKWVKNYNLPYRIDFWVIVEPSNKYKEEYTTDKLVIIPEDFECEVLYKARALEYARRLRVKMVKERNLTDRYVVIQCDDDSLPSKEFILECLEVNADIAIGSICPRPRGFWNTILDYERCIACTIFCNLFTNIGKPIWAHGEGMIISSEVDMNVSYSLSDVCKDYDAKLISSEDMFYLHKTSISKSHAGDLAEDMLHMQKVSIKGFTTYNSEKPIYIVPPLTFGDAVTQRRRWLWGHIRILRYKLLPRANGIRIVAAELSGMLVYTVSTFGIPLPLLGIIYVPQTIIPLLWATLLIWLLIRFYGVGKLMGWKHGLAAVLTSYITVTLNFVVHLIGLVKGDPKRFEVIKKVFDYDAGDFNLTQQSKKGSSD